MTNCFDMPRITKLSSEQSTIINWRSPGVRGKAAFPKFTPRYGTCDAFTYMFPATSRYRNTVEPAQIYSGVSREAYTEHLKTALSKVPSERTLQIRWRPNKDRPAFSVEFLRMFLSRKYGAVEAVYQQAVNSCLVVFKNAESAFAVGRDPHPGHPYGRLFSRQWTPLPQDNSYHRVIKHMERAATTSARFHHVMDQTDRKCEASYQHGYSRALTFRNKAYGPSMLPVLTHSQGMGGLIKVAPVVREKDKEVRAKRLSQQMQGPPLSPKPDVTVTSKVRTVDTHHMFIEALREFPLVVVKFHATWCGPCKAVSPQVDKLSLDHSDVTFVSVDVDENSGTADACKIAVLPTFQLYCGSRLVDELRGNSMNLLADKIRAMRDKNQSSVAAAARAEGSSASEKSKTKSPQEAQNRVKKLASPEEFKVMLQRAEDQLIVVQFTAQWCGLCRSVAPQLEKVSVHTSDVTFACVDVDEAPGLVDLCGVEVLPCFQFYCRGTKVDDFKGGNIKTVVSMIQTLKKQLHV